MSEYNDSILFILPLAIAAIIYFFFISRGKGSKSEEQNKDAVPTITTKPIVTITANYVLADENWNISNGTRMALEILSKRTCIFVFAIVKDKDEAALAKKLLSERLNGLVEPSHILPCQTAMGCASMARQLDSSAHFDYNPEAIHQASIFITSILIAPPSVESPHAKWTNSSFEDFITGGNTEFFSILPK